MLPCTRKIISKQKTRSQSGPALAPGLPAILYRWRDLVEISREAQIEVCTDTFNWGTDICNSSLRTSCFGEINARASTSKPRARARWDQKPPASLKYAWGLEVSPSRSPSSPLAASRLGCFETWLIILHFDMCIHILCRLARACSLWCFFACRWEPHVYTHIHIVCCISQNN